MDMGRTLLCGLGVWFCVFRCGVGFGMNGRGLVRMVGGGVCRRDCSRAGPIMLLTGSRSKQRRAQPPNRDSDREQGQGEMDWCSTRRDRFTHPDARVRR